MACMACMRRSEDSPACRRALLATLGTLGNSKPSAFPVGRSDLDG
jgi:hypothetical protein